MLFVLFLLCQADNTYLTIGCCGLFTVLFIIWLFNNTKFRTSILPTVFLSVAVSCFIFVSYEYFVYTPYLDLNGTNLEGEFTLTEYPSYSNGKYYCMSRFKDKNGKSYKIRISLSPSKQTDFHFEEKISLCEPGDVLNFKGYAYIFGGENKDIRLSYKSKKINLGVYPKGEVSFDKGENKSLLYFLKREKKRTVNLLLSCFDGETASVGISLLMGDKNLLDNGTYEVVRKSGVSHLLAVSGLHLSIWIMLVMKIIENIGLSRRRWAWLLLCFDFLVMFFASFSGSVVRAGVMMALWLLGFIIKGEADSLNSLGFSAVVVLLVNPYVAVNISFLLSYAASFSIITVASYLSAVTEKYIRRFIYYNTLYELISFVVTVTIISLTVTVYTLPIMTYYFGTVSLVSVITNLLIIPVSAPLVVCFGLYVMFWFIPVLSDFLYAVCVMFTRYFLFCVNLTGNSKYSVIGLSSESYILVMVLMAALFSVPFVYSFYKDNNKIKPFEKSKT